METVQGQQILMFYTTIVHIANDNGNNFFTFLGQSAEISNIITRKNSNLKVVKLSARGGIYSRCSHQGSKAIC